MVYELTYNKNILRKCKIKNKEQFSKDLLNKFNIFYFFDLIVNFNDLDKYNDLLFYFKLKNINVQFIPTSNNIFDKYYLSINNCNIYNAYRNKYISINDVLYIKNFILSINESDIYKYNTICFLSKQDADNFISYFYKNFNLIFYYSII